MTTFKTLSIKNKTIPVKNKTNVSRKKHNRENSSIDSCKPFIALSVLFLSVSSTLTGLFLFLCQFLVKKDLPFSLFFKYKMKVTKQLIIKEKGGQFFTDMENIKNFDSSLLHIDRIAMDNDFIIYYVKYLKNINKFDKIFQEDGKNKYLIFFLNDNESEYDKDYMKIKFNTDDDIPLNKQLYFPTVTIIIINIFEKDGKYYPQVYLDDCVCMKYKR